MFRQVAELIRRAKAEQAANPPVVAGLISLRVESAVCALFSALEVTAMLNALMTDISDWDIVSGKPPRDPEVEK
jgi:hypothetical protein